MDQKQWKIGCLYSQLAENDRKIIDYAAGLRTAEQHAADVEERVQIYQEIEKEKKDNV